jgi:hypothetical protein
MRLWIRRTAVVFLGLLLLAVGLPNLSDGTAAGPKAGPRVIKPGDEPGGGGGIPPSQELNQPEAFLIRSEKPYGAVVSAVTGLGGEVTHQFVNVDAIAAKIPRGQVAALEALLGPGALLKDQIIPRPVAVDILKGRNFALPAVGNPLSIPYESVAGLSAAEIQAIAATPDAYLFNNSVINVNALHAAGFAGQGVVVGVIDSGYRPGFPHLSLDGSVIGGENFSGDGIAWNSFSNDGHGTFVAGMISANVQFGFPANSFLANTIKTYSPESVLPGNVVPMIGTAPLSSIYALKVFPVGGLGADTSDILDAIDRAIELRQLYDAGMPGGVNIKVVNMSLSGPTLYAGRDLFDQAVEAFLENDIVAVDSAGNTGPSSITVGSPGTSYGALTVGAASLSHNLRILAELQFGPGIGGLYWPSDGAQSSSFSSRGPNADGRRDPDVTASGEACFGMGFAPTTGSLSIASGTSFSSPSTAGVAAVLRQAFPTATARQIRKAIIMGANPDFLADDPTGSDQGAGYVDAEAARVLLAGGSVPDAVEPPPWTTPWVSLNLLINAGLHVKHGNVNKSFTNLEPGERGEVLYYVPPFTDQVTINVTNIVPELPPEQQNVFFGDDIFFNVHSAKTSRQPGNGDYLAGGFLVGDSTVTIPNPERGIMRVTLSGDFTNAGRVSANVSISSTQDVDLSFSNTGIVQEFDLLEVPVTVPAGTALAQFELAWFDGWENYPANDIDLILIDPFGGINFDGATLDSVERATIANPAAGNWIAIISGFDIPKGKDRYFLRVTLDGTVIH